MRALLAIVLVSACSPEDTRSTSQPALVCGPGTHDDNGTCVLDRRFLIRANRQIVADGTTPAAVFVLGTNADGTAATDQIVLNTNRPGTGLFKPPTLTLDERGGKTTFVPCDAAVPGCTGPLTLTVALASAPTVPVATFDVDLVGDPAIGSIDHCVTGGNVLYVEGDSNFVYRGAITITDATLNRAGGSQRGFVEVLPINPIQGKRWTFEISSVGLGMPMQPGIYTGARQISSAGVAGLNVSNDAPYAYCQSSYAGEFQVHDFVFTTTLQSMTVSFREWCGTPKKAIQGCVHIE